MKNLLFRFVCLGILLLDGSVVMAQNTATVLVKIGVLTAGLDSSEYLTDVATAVDQLAVEALNGSLPSDRHTGLSTMSTACPVGDPFPGNCWDARVEITLQAAFGENTAETVQKIEETVPELITNGRLAQILKLVNANSPVAILGVLVPEPTASPTVAPTKDPTTTAPVQMIETTASVLVKMGIMIADLDPNSYLLDVAIAVNNLATEEVGDKLPSSHKTGVSTVWVACPAGESYPGGCYDATIKFTFQVAETESSKTVEEIEEGLSPFITNGRLAQILEVVNPESPVKILGLIVAGEPTAPPTTAPTMPPATPEPKVQVEEKVLVQIGLEEAGLQTAAYVDDLVEAVKQLVTEVLDGSVSAGLSFNIDLATSACPEGKTFAGGCRNATAIFTFELAAEDVETLQQLMRENLPPFITNGRLQELLDSVNADSPVAILGLETDAPTQSPATETPTESPGSTGDPNEKLTDVVGDNQPTEKPTDDDDDKGGSAADRMQYSALLILAVFWW